MEKHKNRRDERERGGGGDKCRSVVEKHLQEKEMGVGVEEGTRRRHVQVAGGLTFRL